MVAMRSVHFNQVRTGQPTYLDVDVSQLPPDAIEGRSVIHEHGSPVDFITLKTGYPVRIIVVPATQPASTTRP